MAREAAARTTACRFRLAEEPAAERAAELAVLQGENAGRAGRSRDRERALEGKRCADLDDLERAAHGDAARDRVADELERLPGGGGEVAAVKRRNAVVRCP